MSSALATAAPRNPPPRMVGNWQLLREIGSGAYGSVYEAQHRSIIGKHAAIKILHQKISSDPVVATRFLKEASAASLARHENIVQVFDSGVSQEGYFYIVMELLTGATLAELLRRERWAVPRVVHIGAEVAKALAAAHNCGIIHRDIKPDNIFVIPQSADSERVKVVDFGVAKFIGDLGAPIKTKSGTWVGTRAYMSPEQWKTPSDIDGRTDIYALGIILFECLTGVLPFTATSDYEWLIAHTEHPVPDLAQRSVVPPSLALLVQQMLAKLRDQRPPTMQAVVDRLECCLTVAKRGGGQGQARPRHPAWAYLALGGSMISLSPCVSVQQFSAPAQSTPKPTPLPSARPRIPPFPDELAILGPRDLPAHGERSSQISPFAIGKYEVSIRDYREYMGRNDLAKDPPWRHVQQLESILSWPVTGVSHDDAARYCQWKYEFWQGRLPTEAEWELAAHSGKLARRYPWSGDFDWRKVHARQGSGADFVPVNDLAEGATEQGLFHMLGNAAEWTATAARPPVRGFIVLGGSARDQLERDLTRPVVVSKPDAYIGFRCAAQPP